MTPWNDRQISKASKISFTDLSVVFFDVGKLVENSKRIGDETYWNDVERLDRVVAGLMLNHDEKKDFDAVAIRTLSDALFNLKERASEVGDDKGAKIIKSIEKIFLGNLVDDNSALKPKSAKPSTPEEARAQALDSYKDLIHTMFENIGKNLGTGLRASKALATAGKLCDEPDDKENGEYVTKLLDALSSVVGKAKDLFDEKIGESSVTAEEWETIDRIRGEE